VINRHVLLHIRDLNCEPAKRTCDRPLKRNLHTAFRAVVAIVHLRWLASQWRLRVANRAHQQAGLFVEEQAHGRFAFVQTDYLDYLFAINLIGRAYAELTEHLLEFQWQMERSVKAARLIFLRTHLARWMGTRAP